MALKKSSMVCQLLMMPICHLRIAIYLLCSFWLYWLCQSLRVDHNKLWKMLKEMGIIDHLSCLLRNLYAGQEAIVRTRHGKNGLVPNWEKCIPWRRHRLPSPVFLGFPCSSAGKESTCNMGDLGSTPELEISPGEGKNYPLQYSGLGNSMDCIVHGVAKSQTHWATFSFNLRP